MRHSAFRIPNSTLRSDQNRFSGSMFLAVGETHGERFGTINNIDKFHFSFYQSLCSDRRKNRLTRLRQNKDLCTILFFIHYSVG